MSHAEHIRNLLATYCRLMDAADFCGVGRLMSRAVLRTEGGAVAATGASEVAQVLAGLVKVHGDGSPGTHHLVCNISIDDPGADGAVAARSSYLVLQAIPGLALQPVATGDYVDLFVRGEGDQAHGGWRFAERQFISRLSGDLGHHIHQQP